MTEIAARLTRPIRRLSRTATIALVLALLVTIAGAALFVRAYTLRDSVLPGVSVAGVDVGGLARADAQARLRQELAPRLAQPVRVSVGDEAFAVQPDMVWALDLTATEQRAFQAEPGQEHEEEYADVGAIRGRVVALGNGSPAQSQI